MDGIDLFGSRHFLSKQEILRFLIDKIVVLTSSHIGYLHCYNEETKAVELNVWSTDVHKICNTAPEGHYPLENAGVWADCIRKDKTVVHNNYKKFFGEDNLPEGHCPLNRHMSTRIKQNGKIVGIIGVGNAPKPYDDLDIDYFEKLCTTAWAQAQKKIAETNDFIQKNLKITSEQSKEEVFLSIINALSRAIESCDEYTAYHHTNTAHFACLIGEKLGLTEERLLGLRVAALVHDVGKLKIPPDILRKEAPLTKSEYELLKSHVESGANFFLSLDTPWPLYDIIIQHHERIDGSGYPEGLIGDMICIEARIIAAVDTFDCMASERAYRKTPGIEKALSEIKEGRGIRYDEKVVDAMIDILQNNPEIASLYITED